MKGLENLGRLAPSVVAEQEPVVDVATWLTELIASNWELMVSGGLLIVLIGTDIVAISRDVLSDGKFDPKDKEDLLALGRGFGRIIGSFAGAAALNAALVKNPVATLATLTAGAVLAIGLEKTMEQGREIKRAKDPKTKLKATGGAVSTAVITGAVAGSLELGALSIDPTAWLITNAGMAAVIATRPNDARKFVDQVRSYLKK